MLTYGTGKIFLNKLKLKRLIVKTNSSITMLCVLDKKPPWDIKISRSTAESADIYLIIMTENYTLFWPRNNGEIRTELHISQLTDFIQHCTQNSKVVGTNKHVQRSNNNTTHKILCINSRGWCLGRLPFPESLWSLHCSMYTSENSSPFSCLENSKIYRKKKVYWTYNVTSFFSVFVWN
jgi:hypothetical protein